MAYENMTYEVILQRMMNRVTRQYPDLDNREGSIIFNALASAAAEIAIKYDEANTVRNESSVSTATREYILIGCEDMGMDTSVFEASAGKHKARFNIEVPIGSRWNCELYNYTVTEYIGIDENAYAYIVTCETVGTAPNNLTGDLTPITDAPDGLSNAQLVECLIEGENETPDEDIRTAYYEFVNSTNADGNRSQYERWCNEYPGIGNSKVIPLWNGYNTVKISILSASNRAASEELVNEFQEYIDPSVTGMGDGKAPIGAFVTVSTATELPIHINATVSLREGFTDTTPINTALEKYFAEIAYKKTMVAYMNIGSVILGVDGVEHVHNLTINGGTADIRLDAEQIAVLGVTPWGGVVS